MYFFYFELTIGVLGNIMNATLNILVINLKSSSERRARISKQLDILGIPYKFLEATEGKALTEEWIEKNFGEGIKKIYYENLHYSVNKNALACADSHRRAQLIASDFKSGYTLILEDDAQLSRGFKKKIYNTINLMRKHSLHVAFPGYHWSKGSFEKRTDIECSGLSFSFYKYPIDGHVAGSHSYIVDSVGADKLVRANLDKIQDTADTFYIKEKGLNNSTIVLYPKIITVGYLESDIGYSDPDTNLIKKSKLVAYSLALKSPYFYYLLRSWKERRL